MLPGAQGNLLVLEASLIEREALRYTPAGIPVVSAKLRHASRQREAGGERAVEREGAAIFAGGTAQDAARLTRGTSRRVQGFRAPRRKASRTLVLHVTEFDSIEV